MSTMAKLIHDFSDDTIRARLGPSLAFVVPGNWQDFIRWGADHGYALTIDDVRNTVAANPRMMQALARNDYLKGWTADSLEQFRG